ncbi:MAG: dihydrofolate reductase [Oscillospiraceae bacterium]|nr:dihydrofolate reductase [Oscillospiraceae bacterium]
MNLIVAVDKNWGIGCDNKLLAHIPEDMKFFRVMTTDKTVVMGRKTFDSLPNGALPNRNNIVLSRDENFKADNVRVHNSIGIGDDSVFVIGGESIYKQYLPLCTRAYVTKIDAEFEADRYMENLDKDPDWAVESSKKMSTQSGINIEFVTYVNTKLV